MLRKMCAAMCRHRRGRKRGVTCVHWQRRKATPWQSVEICGGLARDVHPSVLIARERRPLAERTLELLAREDVSTGKEDYLKKIAASIHRLLMSAHRNDAAWGELGGEVGTWEIF